MMKPNYGRWLVLVPLTVIVLLAILAAAIRHNLPKHHPNVDTAKTTQSVS